MEMCHNLVLDLLFVGSFESSSFITCHVGKHQVLTTFRLYWLEDWVSTFLAAGHENILVVITPPLIIENQEDLDPASHFNLI